MALPVAFYFGFIVHYGVNVPFQDSWNSSLPLLLDFTRGHLTIADLWQPHNENRMLVPNVILMLLDSATHMNQVVDMCVSAALLVCALVLICRLAHRTLGLSLAWLVPLPYVVLSLIQTQNALWAFQLAWSLILFLSAVVLEMLERVKQRPIWFVMACLAAVLASFSSLQGLLVWPVGLLYGASIGWRARHCLLWLTTGLVTVVVYAANFGPVYPPPDPGSLFTQPLLALRFFILLIGSPFAVHHFIMGTLILFLLAATVVFPVSRERWRRYRLPIALLATTLFFDGLVTEGRVGYGLSQALASRYTTYNLLGLAALYLAAAAAIRPDSSAVGWLGHKYLRLALFAISAATVAWQVGWSIPYGNYQATEFSASLTQGLELLLNYPHVPSSSLGLHLFYPEGDYVKQWAPVLKHYRWSVWSTMP